MEDGCCQAIVLGSTKASAHAMVAHERVVNDVECSKQCGGEDGARHDRRLQAQEHKSADYWLYSKSAHDSHLLPASLSVLADRRAGYSTVLYCTAQRNEILDA